jgi:ABC-type phosphate transport system substrate-binding protein
MPVTGSTTARRVLLGLGCALAVAVATAPAASADFSLGTCAGTAVGAGGSSFQFNAMTAFKAVFTLSDPTGCGASAPIVNYTSSNSGTGRAALGSHETSPANPNGDRDATVRFAGADQAPNATQRQQIEKGPTDANNQDVTTADDGHLLVIPIAIGAIAIPVHMPANCTYTGGTVALYHDRPKIDNVTLEKIFAGEVTTWGAAIPGLAALDAPCAAAPIVRIVRRDSSGTSFALKQLLANVNPARSPAWNSAAMGNQVWPNDGTAVRPTSDGGGSVRSLVDSTPGSIGYIDLATTRSGSDAFLWSAANDPEFWLPLQRQASGDYDDPQADPNGYKTTAAGTTPGANCTTAQPKAALPADGYQDWSGVDYTYSTTAYGACTLTYSMVFDDDASVYCNSPAEEAQARTIKDFFTRAVVSAAGQDALLGAYYDRLPSAALVKATAAVAQLGWKKNGSSGRPCPGDPGTTNPGTTNPPVTTNPGTTPKPTAISNVFTIASARVKSTSIRLSLQLPGAGKIVVGSTAKPKKGASVKLATKTISATGAGAKTLTITLSAKAKKALKKAKKLSVKLTITFTPTGGTKRTVTKTVTVKSGK